MDTEADTPDQDMREDGMIPDKRHSEDALTSGK